MPQASPRLLGHSWTDDITLTATSEALPVANVQDPDVRKPWRSTGTATQVIAGTAAAAQDTGAVYIENTNAERFILQLSDDGFATCLYAEAFEPLAHRITFDAALLWLSGASGGDLIADANGDTIVDDNADTIIDHLYSLPLPIAATDLRLLVIGPNAAEGYLEMGRLKAGPYVSPVVGHDWGATVETREDSDLIRTRGSSQFAAVEDPYRAVSLAFSWLTDDELWALEELKREIGRHDDVLLCVYPDDSGKRGRLYTILGRLEAWTPATRQQTRRHAAGLTVQGVT